MSSWAIVTALAFTVLAGSAETKVETWQDRSIHFEDYRKFDFASTPLGAAARQARGIRTLEDEIREHVARQLETRGFVQDRDNDVDFLVSYEFVPPAARAWREPVLPAVRCRKMTSTVTFGFGKASRYDNLLYLEFRDFTTGLPVWRGRTLRVMKRDDDGVERIALAVKRIIEHFPPERATE